MNTNYTRREATLKDLQSAGLSEDRGAVKHPVSGAYYTLEEFFVVDCKVGAETMPAGLWLVLDAEGPMADDFRALLPRPTLFCVSGSSGAPLGHYRASSEQDARDQCAQDAGYASEADIAERLGAPSDLLATAVNGVIVTETPHRGEPVTWTATSREDFVIRVMRANPRADIDPDITFDDCVAWMRRDLRDLEIVEA